MKDYSLVKDFKELKYNGFFLKIYKNVVVFYYFMYENIL